MNAEFLAALPWLECAAAVVIIVAIDVLCLHHANRRDAKRRQVAETPTCCDRCLAQQIDPSTVALFTSVAERSAYRVH